jgi:hypothetical protein
MGCPGCAALFPGSGSRVSKRRVVGRPRHISTSYVERQNLTLRMQQRRFTRLTNAISKKLENHEAAVALYAMAFNFCRVHETLRVTPAMQLGVTDHIWSIGELVDAALSNDAQAPVGRKAGPFRIIEVVRFSQSGGAIQVSSFSRSFISPD